jgi:hypothetical protein
MFNSGKTPVNAEYWALDVPLDIYTGLKGKTRELI